MASKIFCCCCEASEEPSTTVGSYNPRTSQQHHPRTFDLNENAHKNSRQKRHPQHSFNNRTVKAGTLARP
ncbi:testis-expressed protein 53 [Saccopteryx bilineata]|uniref:testis-expressed protein 53 n=1 Tax=Saccopteryx bilineata TaxID=59482 RepID=UPI00338D6477